MISYEESVPSFCKLEKWDKTKDNCEAVETGVNALLTEARLKDV